MDLKKIDQFLKDKVQEVKDQKRHEEMIGLVAMLGENISDDLKKAVSEIKIDPPTVPDITIPEIKVPDIPAPQVTVNVPEMETKGILQAIKDGFANLTFPKPEVTVQPTSVTVPEPKVTVNVEKPDAPIVNIPPFPEEMKVRGDVGISGVDRKNPFPVQLVDLKGRPYEAMMGGAISGGSASGASSSTVSLVNADGNYYNSDNPLPITGSITSTPGATYYASDAVGSVNVIQSVPITVTEITNSTATALVDSGGVAYSGSNPLPISGSFSSTPYGTYFASDTVGSVNVVQTVGLTDTQLRANSIDVQQASGASWSTNVLSLPNVTVSSVTTSIGATILNGEGLARDTWGSSQVGTWNIGTVTTVTGVTNSLQASLIDSGGIQYSGSNPVPVSVQRALESIGLDVLTTRQVSGASDSVNVLSMPSVTVTSITNSTASALVDSTGVQYSGSNPVPTKEVRSATPSQTSPSVGITSTSILASNANRLGATIYNEGSAICYTKLGGTASLTSYSVQIASGGYYEVPFGYTGAIDGITSASTAQLRVTEIT